MERKEIVLSQRDYETLADFRYALRKFLKFSEEAASAVGLTQQQYQALLALKGSRVEEPLTVGELAERLQSRPHSVVALVNRLARQGLLVRQPAREDKRQVLVLLTDVGEQVLEKLAWAHREELGRLKQQINQMATYLDRSD